MFISDTAITRPVLTIVTMLALVVFGIASLVLLEDRRVPETCSADRRRVAARIPAPRPKTSSARSSSRSRTRSRASAASIASPPRRSTASAHRSWSSCTRRILQEATQQIRDEIGGSAATCRPSWRSRSSPASTRPTSPSCRWCCRPRATGAELTLLADPGITRQLRGITGVARSRRRRRQRELTVELRPQACRRQRRRRQVVQALQAAEPRGARRPSDRGTARRADHPLLGRLDSPATSSRSSSRRRADALCGWATSPTCGRHRGAPLRSGVQRRGSGRDRGHQGEGLQHDRGVRRIRQSLDGIGGTLPAGVRLHGSCATPATAWSGRWATCSGRSSRARR
jgi:hypothetical protein